MSGRKRTFDVYGHVTERIVAALEAGTPPWRCPWGAAGHGLPLRATGEAYRGINVLMLWLAAAARGYRARHWMTYRQASALGGQVRRGETSSTVIKVGSFRRHEDGAGDGEDPGGAEAPEARRYARAYRVFNAGQIDGLPERYHAAETPPRDIGTGADPAVMAWLGATGLRMETRAYPAAFYDPGRDLIVMPPPGAFESGHAHAATLAHEAVHATGHAGRLGRDMGNAKAAYAREELIAEIGAAFVCARLGVRPDHDQNAAYVADWLKALRGDRREIFRAAGAAQKACDWLMTAAGMEGPASGADEGALAGRA